MHLLYAAWNRVIGHGGSDTGTLPYKDVRAVLEAVRKLYDWKNRKSPENDRNELSEQQTCSHTVLHRMDLTESRMIFLQDKIIWERVVVPGAKNGYLKVVQADEADSVRMKLYGQVYIDVFRSRTFAGSQSALIYKKTAFPLLVRSAVPGDSIQTQSGTKQLKELFSSWHVPKEDRWKIPVLEDRCGIQAVLGKYSGYPDRVSAKHRIQQAACSELETEDSSAAENSSAQQENRFLVCGIHQFGDDIEQ
jgi:tRNA(Ile)-lysidine synthetase-like protein